MVMKPYDDGSDGYTPRLGRFGWGLGSLPRSLS